MRTSYRDKGWRLNQLLVEIVRFFKEKGFLVSSPENDSKNKIVSVKTGESLRHEILEVSLSIDPEGSLQVTFSSSKSSSAIRNSSLFSIFGGSLTLGRLKMDESLERLEREFWKMADEFMVSS